MKLYSKDDNYILYNDNMLNLLQDIEPCSIDSIVTDPPYEIGFMNKSWDKSGIAFQIDTWKKCYEVLKPGGYMLVFGGCYDEHTEYLTSNGWKLIKDATIEDNIVTLNPNTHTIELHNPYEVVKLPYDGDMYHFSTNKIDLMVTANHKCYVSTLGNKTNPYRLERADICFDKAVRMKKNAINNNADVEYFTLPSVEKSNGHYTYLTKSIQIPMNIWLKFFGLYMAQGSSTISTSYKVKICHYIKEDLDIIESELSPYFHICRYDEYGTVDINNKELCLYLHQFGTALTKHLPEWLKTLSVSQIKLFIEWYLRGDGDRKLNRWRGYTASKQLADDFQELALYGGISADIKYRNPRTSILKGRSISDNGSYVITFNLKQNEPEVYQKNKQKSIVTISHRADFVYCVEVPNHIIYVRRNGKCCWCGNTRTFHRIACAIEDAGFEIRDTIMWLYSSGFPKSTNIGLALDKKLGVESDVVGVSTNGSGASYVKLVNHEKGDTGVGYLDGSGKVFDLKEPVSDIGKQFNGWGTQLKPAYEPILIARKPCEGGCVDNVYKYGVGGINIDECRVPANPGEYDIRNYTNEDCFYNLKPEESNYSVELQPRGRFPANIILSYDDETYDEVCSGFPISEKPNGSIPKPTYTNSTGDSGIYGHYSENVSLFESYNDTGSASRYFYCAKASKRDRNEGLDAFEMGQSYMFELIDTTPLHIQDEIRRILNL